MAHKSLHASRYAQLASRKLLRKSRKFLHSAHRSRPLRYPNEPSDSYDAYCKSIQRINNLEAIRKLTYTSIKKRLDAIAITLEKLGEENSKAVKKLEDLHNKCTAHWI